jgi:predicted CopG family antitoxin
MATATRKLKRIQIDMSERAFSRLEWLKDATDSQSFTEVIRDALELREAVVRLAQEGKSIMAEDPITKNRAILIVP